MCFLSISSKAAEKMKDTLTKADTYSQLINCVTHTNPALSLNQICAFYDWRPIQIQKIYDVRVQYN